MAMKMFVAAIGLLGVVGLCSVMGVGAPAYANEAGVLVLEDFQSADQDGFPIDWQHENQRSQAKGRDAYKIQSQDGKKFLAAKDAGQRVKKRKIDWDPKVYPVLTWRWRLHKAPSGSEPIAALYASLDTDLMFIPVFTKYIWAPESRKGRSLRAGCLADQNWWCRAECFRSGSGWKSGSTCTKILSVFISTSRLRRPGVFRCLRGPV
ncbi:MAG: DUF3047 domain-containing protein [Nitrospira sp.]|nr:DUF3047 domain-containing protein [Nitrospira sp.]